MPLRATPRSSSPPSRAPPTAGACASTSATGRRRAADVKRAAAVAGRGGPGGLGLMISASRARWAAVAPSTGPAAGRRASASAAPEARDASATILVVDDDPSIRRGLAPTRRGYATLEAADGDEGARLAVEHEPDLVLTDLAMPGTDGFELIARLRRSGRTPILVLSVRGGDADKIRALDLGADDFVVKPFSVPELLARVRAQLRRHADGAGAAVLEFPGLTLDRERRRVTVEGAEIRLTPTELAILELLASHAGKPVTIRQIIGRVWHGAPGTPTPCVSTWARCARRSSPTHGPATSSRNRGSEYRFVAEPVG